MTERMGRLDAWWEEHSKTRRLDRNAGNLCMLIGLMLPTLSIILQGPVPNSQLSQMPVSLQIAMCGCIFVGCAVKLHGALAGMRFYFPKTPIPRCYRYGVSGAFPAFAGTWVYGFYILSSSFHNHVTVLSALSGIATPMFGLGIMVQAFFYWLEARRIEENQRVLTEAARHQNGN